MPAFDYDDVPNWRGLTVIDQNSDPVGTITDIYVDDVTGRPEWATVNTGLFGSRTTFVPLSQAELRDRRVRLPYDRSHIKDAPNVDVDGHLNGDEEARLYQHYGLDYLPAAQAGTTGPAGSSGASSEFIVSATDDVDEESAVETRESRRLRLRRHVVTRQDPDRDRGV